MRSSTTRTERARAATAAQVQRTSSSRLMARASVRPFGAVVYFPRCNQPAWGFAWTSSWSGKANTRPRPSPPATIRTVEVFEADAGSGAPWRNRLIGGDNRLAAAALLAELAGRVDLVYVDPPFATGTVYSHRVDLGDGAGSAPAPGITAPVYRDVWGPGLASYLQMLYERLTLVHALLADGGALYVHVDPTVGHYVKVLLDDVFGSANFQREIVWRIGWVSGYKSAVPNWVRNHDTILYYAKGRPAVFNKEYVPHAPSYRRRGAAARANGRGLPIEDVWNANPAEQALRGARSLDSIQIKSFSTEKTGFPTQKNESLLRRIVAASSNPGGLVMDLFCGSGTTLVAAEQLGRRWIGCDLAPFAIHTARKRLLMLPARQSFAVCAVDVLPQEAEPAPPLAALAGAPLPAAAWAQPAPRSTAARSPSRSAGPPRPPTRGPLRTRPPSRRPTGPRPSTTGPWTSTPTARCFATAGAASGPAASRASTWSARRTPTRRRGCTRWRCSWSIGSATAAWPFRVAVP